MSLISTSSPSLVEEFIDGREFHVGVVGNASLQMLPPAEIDFSIFDDIHDRLCTYEANFDPELSGIPKLMGQVTD